MSYIKLTSADPMPTPGLTVRATTDSPPRLSVVGYGAKYGSSVGIQDFNTNTTTTTPSPTTRTYIEGSMLPLIQGDSAYQLFKWRWSMVKTGAGFGTSTIDLAIGDTGSTGDVARVTFTKPAGTGVIDTGVCEIALMFQLGVDLQNVTPVFMMTHNLPATGHMGIPSYTEVAIPASYTPTVQKYVGVCITTGALDGITIDRVVSTVSRMG